MLSSRRKHADHHCIIRNRNINHRAPMRHKSLMTVNYVTTGKPKARIQLSFDDEKIHVVIWRHYRHHPQNGCRG